MRRRIRQLWPRRSKKFDGFERVSLHTHGPEYGEDKTPIHYALLDPAGDHVIRRSHFERPGSLPAWNNTELRKLYLKLPSDVQWYSYDAPKTVVKLWADDTPACIQPFEF